MDYIEHMDWSRHSSWDRFLENRTPGRLVLLTTKADVSLQRFTFRADDTLLFGRETAGVPEDVHQYADARVSIPMQSGMRSLNLAVSASIATWEVLRQTGFRPDENPERLTPSADEGAT